MARKVIIDAYAEGFFEIDSVYIGNATIQYCMLPPYIPLSSFVIIPYNIQSVQSDLYSTQMYFETQGLYRTTLYKYNPNYVKITGKPRLVDSALFMKRAYTSQYNVFSCREHFQIDTSKYGLIQTGKDLREIGLSSFVSKDKFLNIIDCIRNKKINFRSGFDQYRFPTIYKTKYIDLQSLVSIQRELGSPEYRLGIAYSRKSKKANYWIQCSIESDSLRIYNCGHLTY